MQGSTKPDLVCEAEFNLTTAQLVLVTPLISLQLVSVLVTCHCTVGGVGVPVALAVNVAVDPQIGAAGLDDGSQVGNIGRRQEVGPIPGMK